MTKKKILQDHKKRGNKLIAPMSDLMSSDFSYVEQGIPQIIWIALINKKYGLKRGTELSLKFVQIIDKLKIDKEVPYNISWFSKINQNQADSIKDELIKVGIFQYINEGLKDLLNIYPKCPLCKIFDNNEHNESNISSIKEILITLYDKHCKESTFALANTVYFMGMCQKLHIVEKSPLENLEKLVDYPETEESKVIASIIRATTNVLLSDNTLKDNKNWISIFWNRGLELEPCTI